jgi:hypothetical protein
MTVIQEITSQTSAGTTATAGSIGRLAELAGDMQKSVAGFKLPEEHVQGELHVDLTVAGGTRSESAKQRPASGDRPFHEQDSEETELHSERQV